MKISFIGIHFWLSIKKRYGNTPCNEVAKVHNPRQPSAMLPCHHHEAIGEQRGNEGMENPIAEWIVNEQHSSHNRIQMSTWEYSIRSSRSHVRQLTSDMSA